VAHTRATSRATIPPSGRALCQLPVERPAIRVAAGRSHHRPIRIGRRERMTTFGTIQ
jgi:hypothetical protein